MFPGNQRTEKWVINGLLVLTLEGLVGGYQLVIWKKPSKEFMHARGADLSSVIEPLLQDLIAVHSGESSVLVMCARNEDRDQLLTDSVEATHKLKSNQLHPQPELLPRPALSINLSTAILTAGHLTHSIKKNAMHVAL